jgi:hypothetical protein
MVTHLHRSLLGIVGLGFVFKVAATQMWPHETT